MKKFLIPCFLLLLGCGQAYKPDLSGWKAYTQGGRQKLYLSLDGRKKAVDLPGDKSVGYRFVQWTKAADQLLVVQAKKTNSCYDFLLLTVDTAGVILDTLYKAPPNTLLNFRLAPNDSLLLIKSYVDLCDGDPYRFRYTFFNRFTRKSLEDTLVVTDASGIPLRETLWSPDSRRVIIPEWSGLASQAFLYDLATRDTVWIDEGKNFLWSPSDNNLIAYQRNHSIYAFNPETREKEELYKGRKKRSVTEFRWNPTGAFLMIHLRSYFLNIEAPPTGMSSVVYFSLEDRRESEAERGEQRVDTWKQAPVRKTDSVSP